MKHVRVRTMVVFGAAALAGALLLHTSQNVQIAEDGLARVRAAVLQERESIRLLNAEWAYLNNPDRLEKLAKDYLDMMPPQPASMTSEPDEIPARLEEEIPSVDPAIAPRPVSLQAPPPGKKPSVPPSLSPSPAIKSKPSDKDFTALLKDIRKGGKL